MENQTEFKFMQFFNNKGCLAPFAEVAVKNFLLKSSSPYKDAIYYFAIGHINKYVDIKNAYGMEYSDEIKSVTPTRFLMLQKDRFDYSILEDVLGAIRNINSHYIHTFDTLKIDSLSEDAFSFIKETFEFSVVLTYCKMHNLSLEVFYDEQDFHNNNLRLFLCDSFYPNEIYQKAERDSFLKLSLSKAIDEILFINNSEKIFWQLNNSHHIFDIHQGKYLSHIACIFTLNLFLYKDQATHLVSKIKGFRNNSSDKLRKKVEILTFFFKKI